MLTPWWRSRKPSRSTGERADEAPTARHVAATRLLDHDAAPVRALAEEIDAGAAEDAAALLRAAHVRIGAGIGAVYSVDDLTPTSTVLRRGAGSCSQRFGALESVARRHGIATRSHGLLVDGRFWIPRFPRVRAVVPDHVVLAWPQFHGDGAWRDVGDLLGGCTCPDGAPECAFTNTGSTTLFDAAGTHDLRWQTDGRGGRPALAQWVRADLGFFASRDDLFARHGQTLAWPIARVADAVLRRRTAR